jgi:uncharacterized membrane protein
VNLCNGSNDKEKEQSLQKVLDYIKCKGGSVNLDDLKKAFGARQTEGYIKALINKGIVNKHFDL